MTHLILAAVLTVVINDFSYEPKNVVVTAGESVRFVNKDDEAHTVTLRGGGFDSGGLDTGDTWTYRFTRPGKYAYFCSLHPFMTGTVTVRPAKGAHR